MITETMCDCTSIFLLGNTYVCQVHEDCEHTLCDSCEGTIDHSNGEED